MWVDGFSDQDHIKRERRKAAEMRESQWWRQQLGHGNCYHCEKKYDKSQLTMDHLIPLARGGKSTKSNVVVSCKECNTKKGFYTRGELALMEISKMASTEKES